jgi:hypothetical protein
MRTSVWFVGVLAVILLSAAGCEIFEDREPKDIFFHVEGTPGGVVQVLYSKEFVAGVDEAGVTRVEVFGADTVVHTMPFDTVIDVRIEQRLLIQAQPLMETDTLDLDARVDVDDRNLYDESGVLYPTVPWKFLYQFNHRFTDIVEVVL